MQLGARWRRGAPPHRGVPPILHALIAEQETLHPDADAWTLTWLEGRPRCALDDAVTVTLDATGTPMLLTQASAAAQGTPGSEDEDEDDGWLS